MAQKIILPYPTCRLVDAIIRLPDSEFWKLVSFRLNTPLSTNQIEEGNKIPAAKDRQYWTEEFRKNLSILVKKYDAEVASC